MPVCIYNNAGGKDKATLAAFREPSWNNPVVRAITADKKDIVPRLNGDYSRKGLVGYMISALKKAGKPVPGYLSLLQKELSAVNTQQAVFGMYCFWTGEVRLGGLEGVLATEPGFLDGHEVVSVTYDPTVLPYTKLVSIAQQQKCATRVYTRSDDQQTTAKKFVGALAQRHDGDVRPDDQPKYQLSRSPLRYLPMTPMQQARVNAAYGRRQNFQAYLSPRQLQLLSKIQGTPRHGWRSTIGLPIATAWATIK